MQQAIQAEVQQALGDYTRAFPGRAHVHLTSCQDISTGWEGDLLSVHLRYTEQGQTWEDEFVLKLYAGDSGPQKARREFRALRWLAGVGYPAPQALFASPQEAAGRAYVAMERIAGETVAHLLGAASGRQRRGLIRRCCRLYADLHALDWEAHRELCGGELMGEGEREGEEEGVVQAWLRQVRAICQRRLPGVFDPALDWLQERSLQVVCRRVCYLHGDFHFNNVMLREDGRLVVIDWTGPLLSDYRFDLGWTLLLLRTQGRAHLADPLLVEYQRRAGRPVEQLAFFEAAACCRRLFDLVCSAREGAAALGMKPEVTGEIARQGAHARAVYARLQACTDCDLPHIEAFIDALTEASAQGASVRPTVL